MEKEDDLSLLQNINYLRKQLAETEDCLQSISSIELNGSLQHEQRLNSTEISHPDTTDDDAQAEEIYRELSSTLTPSEQQRRSLRSERGFRGNGNGVAAEDHHRKVALLRRDNRQLMLENRNLLQQLDGRSSELHEVRRKVEHMLLEKHDAPSRNAVLELNSKLCDSLDRQAQDQDLISSLRENISQLVTKLDQSSILKAKADEQKNEAVHAMEDFAKTFQLYKEKTKHQLEENDGINSKLKEIINERDHLQHQVSLLGNEVELARKQTKKLRDAAGVAADDAADVIVDLRRQLSSQERQIDEMQERQIAEAEARERSDADASHGSGVTAGDRSVRILETGLEIAERLQVANARLREENEALRVAAVTTARARDVAAATPPPAIAGELRRERERAAAARADCEREVARSRALEGKLVQVRALARAAAGKVELLTEQAAAARRELAACQAKLGEAEKQASQRESTEKSLRNQLQVRSRANQSLKVKLEEAVTEVALKVKGQEVASEKLKVARREVKDMQARSQLAENERAERQKEWQGLNMTLRQEVAEREEKISQLGAILTQREADVIKVQDASERIQDRFNDYQNGTAAKEAEFNQLVESLNKRAAEDQARVERSEVALGTTRRDLDRLAVKLRSQKDVHAREMAARGKAVGAVEAMLGRTRNENGKLEETVGQQHHLLEESTSRIAELEEAQAAAESQVTDLNVRLQKSRNQSNEEAQRLVEEMNAIKQIVEQKNQEISQLSIATRNASAQQQTLDREAAELRRDLQQEREENEAHVSELEEQLRSNRNLLIRKQQQVTEHESKVEEAEEKLVAAREEAALQETQARVLVAEMTRASSQLAAAEKRTKEQSDRIADLQRRLRSAESELSERDFDATELRAAAVEKQTLLQQRTLQVQCLEQQFKTFRVNMEQQALQLNQHLEGAVQKERAKDTQIQELQRHLDASQLETRDVAARLGEARQKSEVDGAAICKLVSDLERIVAFQKDEVATLTRELDAKTRAVAAETDTWRDSERQVRDRLHEASVKLEHVEERESTLRTELQQLATIYNRKEADAERMTDEIGALRVREASLAAELEQQQRELQQQRTQHQSQVASLQTELRRCGDESRESRDAASRDIRQRENKLQALMTQLNDCQRQLHEARVTIHSQESRNRHLSGQLRTYEDGQYLFSPEQALLQHRTSSVYDEPDTPTKSTSNHSSKAEDRNKIFDYRVKEIDESGSRRVSIAGGSTGENRDESQTFQGMLDKVLLEIDGHHHTSHNHTASYPAQRDTDSNSSYSVHPN